MPITIEDIAIIAQITSDNPSVQAPFYVRHESAIVLADRKAVEKVLTQHISYPALGLLQ